MIALVVVCVAFCLGSGLLCMGYVSGDGNMYPPAVEFQLVCLSFINQIQMGKKNYIPFIEIIVLLVINIADHIVASESTSHFSTEL